MSWWLVQDVGSAPAQADTCTTWHNMAQRLCILVCICLYCFGFLLHCRLHCTLGRCVCSTSKDALWFRSCDSSKMPVKHCLMWSFQIIDICNYTSGFPQHGLFLLLWKGKYLKIIRDIIAVHLQVDLRLVRSRQWKISSFYLTNVMKTSRAIQ